MTHVDLIEKLLRYTVAAFEGWLRTDSEGCRYNPHERKTGPNSGPNPGSARSGERR